MYSNSVVDIVKVEGDDGDKRERDKRMDPGLYMSRTGRPRSQQYGTSLDFDWCFTCTLFERA